MRVRARAWAGILAAYFSSQTLTQLAGIGAGLVFVNLMPVREFALYTLALSVVALVAFLSDLGSTTSLLHFWRRAAAEAVPFEGWAAAVLSLRRGAFLLGAAGVLVVFPAVAAAEGFALAESLPAAAAVAATVWFQIGSSLNVLRLRLEDRYARSYRAELAGGLLRLTGALALAATGALKASLAVLSGALASAATARLARPDGPAPPRTAPAEIRARRRDVLRYLLPTLPSALYFSLRGPLVVWLAAAFGSAATIAEVGALGRLGLVVGMFSSLVAVVFMPRLAGTADERLYRARYLRYGAALAGVAAALLAAAAVAPRPFLALLGPQYRGLDRELLLVVGAAGLSLLDGYSVSVNLSRSWTRLQGPAVLSLAVTQALLVVLLPLGTTAGVLRFNLLSAAAALAGQAAITWLGFVRPRWVEWS